ncbi:hypothetical protein VH569_28075 [Azospirillum sp. 11R-A]|uniref:hypothetical protein n=1 Tax=Azospirillum sp. 11R-A TaxID=3111634 RepID=UPI003C21946C
MSLQNLPDGIQDVWADCLRKGYSTWGRLGDRRARRIASQEAAANLPLREPLEHPYDHEKILLPLPCDCLTLLLRKSGCRIESLQHKDREMNPIDFNFLEDAKNSLIEASINRVSHSGEMVYYYQISIAEVKERTGRQRIHESVIESYLAFFSMNGILTRYNNTFSIIEIELNLSNCVLNPSQARFFSIAMETFRSSI